MKWQVAILLALGVLALYYGVKPVRWMLTGRDE